jgi:hypothetical protein
VLTLVMAGPPSAADAAITIRSSSRGAAATVSGAEVSDPANYVVLALTQRGTLRLASTLENLNERDEWVPDVDIIEITSP